MKKNSKSKNFCRFCEKNIESDKVRDHCHLTGKNRGPAHSICNFIETQKQSNFSPIVIHNFINYDCHMFLKKLVDKINDSLEFNFIDKTDQEYISVRYGCIRFRGNYRFLSRSLVSLVKTLIDNSHKNIERFRRKNC